MPGRAATTNAMFRKTPFELIFWIAAIFSLAMSDPNTPHYSLCLFRLLGWQHCPGCGLGHAIAFLLRGNLSASWHSHPLGGFAAIVIICRIADLSAPYYIQIKTNILRLKKNSYGRKHLLGFSGH